MRRTAEERFWSKVEKTSTCWLWTAGRSTGGYGVIWDAAKRGTAYAHRMSWSFVHGEIPEGMVLDHVCHDPQVCAGGDECQHRQCVNPDHLRAVPTEQNTSRERAFSAQAARTECPHGHPYSPDNTGVSRRGDGTTFRYCRTCKRAREAANPEAQRLYKRAYRKRKKDKESAMKMRGCKTPGCTGSFHEVGVHDPERAS